MRSVGQGFVEVAGGENAQAPALQGGEFGAGDAVVDVRWQLAEASFELAQQHGENAFLPTFLSTYLSTFLSPAVDAAFFAHLQHTRSSMVRMG